MFCPYCGKEIIGNADICFGCGRYIDKVLKPKAQDSTSAGWWWLGFSLPVVGFILWLVWSDSTPIKAKKLGLGALIGTIVSVILIVMVYILILVFSFMIGINIAYM